MIVYSNSNLLNYDCVDLTSIKNGYSDGANKVQIHGNEVTINGQAATLEISQEALEAYKNMYQKKEPEPKYLNIQFTPDGLAFGNEDWPDIEDFVDVGRASAGNLFVKGLDLQKWHDIWTSVTVKSDMLISAYAKTYDEICRGYADGTRVRYIIDTSTEDLYRPVTMEEELEDLKKEYEGWASNLDYLNEKIFCSARKSSAIFHTEMLVKGYCDNLSISDVQKMHIRYQELKSEENIHNIKQVLMDAAALFVSKYKESGLGGLNLPVL